MRPFLSLLLVLTAWLAFATPAFPYNVSHFPSNHDAVLGACAAAGGIFAEDSGGYGCTKHNCDGKGKAGGGDGHDCIVGCTSGGECTGQTPGRIVPVSVTLLMLLQNGSNVSHAPQLVEGPSSNGSNGSPAPAVTPPPGGPSFF